MVLDRYSRQLSLSFQLNGHRQECFVVHCNDTVVAEVESSCHLLSQTSAAAREIAVLSKDLRRLAVTVVEPDCSSCIRVLEW